MAILLFATNCTVKFVRQTVKTLVGLIGIVIVASILVVVLEAHTSKEPLSFLDSFVSDSLLDDIRQLVTIEKAVIGILLQYVNRGV